MNAPAAGIEGRGVGVCAGQAGSARGTPPGSRPGRSSLKPPRVVIIRTAHDPTRPVAGLDLEGDYLALLDTHGRRAVAPDMPSQLRLRQSEPPSHRVEREVNASTSDVHAADRGLEGAAHAGGAASRVGRRVIADAWREGTAVCLGGLCRSWTPGPAETERERTEAPPLCTIPAPTNRCRSAPTRAMRVRATPRM